MAKNTNKCHLPGWSGESNLRQDLTRSRRALRIIRKCNRILVNCREEKDLLHQMCELIVNEAGYPFVWVGFLSEEGDKIISPAAEGGLSDKNLNLGKTWKEMKRKEGAINEVLRSSQAVIKENIDLGGDSTSPIDRKSYELLCLPLTSSGRIFGVMNVYAENPGVFDEKERELLREISESLAYGVTAIRTVTEQLDIEKELKQTIGKLQGSMEGAIQALAVTIEMRDPYTAGHQRRVAKLAGTLGKEMGLSSKKNEGLKMAGLVHDIGKIYVPVEILTNPGILSEFEYKVIKAHPRYGYDITREIDWPWPVSQMILQHHERLNGSGYPLGLSGEEIMEESKILSVADVVEAMSSHRPYRANLGIEAALEEIKSNKGTIYDPQVVEACIHLFEKKGYQLDEEESIPYVN
ncbi:HD domain-containing protein [bacterium]|nr:HD domain-containing protein [bacterium]